MELAIRLLAYGALGLVLVVANLWFVRSIYKNFVSPEYVIAPFNVIDPSGKTAGDKAGLALAQMMAARLSNLQSQLQATQSSPQQQSNTNLNNPLAVTTLFIPRPVMIPTGLFEPVNISATVGGVEVGGIIAWVQKMLSREYILVFTTYERADRAIISADLGNLAPGARLWFESSKHPDDIATNAAYALIQLRLAEKQPGPIKDLELADFRHLFETIFRVDELNRRAAQGYVVEANFMELLPSMEVQAEKLPKWPELIYLTASIAEGAHNLGKAVLHYRKLQSLGSDNAGTDARIRESANMRLQALGAVHRQLESESEERFVRASHEFSRKMALAGPDPIIAFVKPQGPGIQAFWNVDMRRYEVNPANIDTAGLPQYVALMGRFLDRNFRRCFDDQTSSAQKPTVEWWNEFRYSIVDYLIQTQEEFKGVTTVGTQSRLFAALKSIEDKAGLDAAKRLAFELLNRFECAWTPDNITAEIVKINSDRGFMPEATLVTAMSSHGFGVKGRKK
jgi:hypothetical protein